MNMMKGEIPGDSEILAQLDRILSSPYFSNSSTQKCLLRYVVMKAMANEATDEHEIGFAIFFNYDPQSHKVRANATLVRGKLANYYEGEGTSEAVLIELPPGAAYRVTFRYRHQASAVRAARKAVLHLHKENFNSFISRGLLAEAEKLEPNSSVVSLSRAEIALLSLMNDHLLGIWRPSRPWSKVHHTDAWAAVAASPSSCNAQLLLGFISVFSHLWTRGREAFQKALELDPVQSRSSPWYVGFLALDGRVKEALGLARVQADEHLGNITWNLTASLCSYLNRDYDSALDFASEVAEFHQKPLLCSLLAGLTYLEKADFSRALKSFIEASEIEDSKWSTAEVFYGFEGEKGQRFFGLVILALMRKGSVVEAKNMLAALKNRHRVRPFQLAIAYMAVEDFDRAARSLKRAALQGDICVYLVDLLPLFDPLRVHPDFKSIVAYYGDIRSASF